jgi:predicted membrane protein
MEWYTIFAVFLIIILTVLLGILLACMLSGQRCTVSCQKRTPNYELTRIQQEEEQKREKKFSSKLKRTFGSSPKPEQPISPVEDIKTIEFTLKLGDDQKDAEQITTIGEPSMILLPKTHGNHADRDERQKKREAIRKKYNL